MWVSNGRPELEVAPIGQEGWRVSDARVPQDDARHVVAFIEAADQRVEVLWVRGSVNPIGRFTDLDSALTAVEEVVAAAGAGAVSRSSGSGSLSAPTR